MTSEVAGEPSRFERTMQCYGGLVACPLELFKKIAYKLYIIKCVLAYSLAYRDKHDKLACKCVCSINYE